MYAIINGIFAEERARDMRAHAAAGRRARQAREARRERLGRDGQTGHGITARRRSVRHA
jgi:hypothetical protein